MGTLSGGAALSIRSVTGKPIKFTGRGEKLEDFEIFYPERMASRILGMGYDDPLSRRRNKTSMKQKRKRWRIKLKPTLLTLMTLSTN